MPLLSISRLLPTALLMAAVSSTVSVAETASSLNGSANTANAAGTSSTAGTGSGPAAKLAAKLGKPARLLVGLGAQGANGNVVSTVESQAAKIEIY
ncbi:MAG: hypothetical protein JWN43_4913, partial [Gammaproteobacteria bacterium]|nr:hypothetical protein [Gammaproteobacteria bacterium]